MNYMVLLLLQRSRLLLPRLEKKERGRIFQGEKGMFGEAREIKKNMEEENEINVVLLEN